MSTLNSSQLYVKRSSTRLHAPPGGHSSLSFGSGGFGTTDAAVGEPKHAAHGDPADSQPPSTAGSFRANNSSSSYGVYNHPANNQSSDGSSYPHHHAQPPVAFHAINGYAPVQGPSVSSHGYTGSSGYAMSTPIHMNENRPVSTQSTLSWGERGAQPPLTSSKRDQNWEKKRRLWLARKHAGGGGANLPPATPFAHLPPPPATAMGYAGNGYDDSPAYNPPSPLTKFMAQQTHSNKPSTASGFDALPPTSYGRPSSSSSAMDDYPPPRTAIGYREGLQSAQGTASSNYGLRQSLTSSAGGYTHTPPYSTVGGGSGGAYPSAPPRSSMPPSTAYSTASSISSRRQPPGGSSNWNPYS